ncbi:MAG: CoA transferase [Betaproteobacteria bacterium]|nr:CoA transferase [Betaproteobacteria bacterium]
MSAAGAAGSLPGQGAPLDGLLVLELASSPGACFAGSLLADFGATVVVCENTGAGTPARHLRPGVPGDIWWSTLARNKYSLALEPANDGAAEVIDRLFARAALVVTDRVRAQWRDNPWLSRILRLNRPPLVAEIFPTGADLPQLWAGSVAPELTGAATGMMSLTGWGDGPRSWRPGSPGRILGRDPRLRRLGEAPLRPRRQGPVMAAAGCAA